VVVVRSIAPRRMSSLAMPTWPCSALIRRRWRLV